MSNIVKIPIPIGDTDTRKIGEVLNAFILIDSVHNLIYWRMEYYGSFPVDSDDLKGPWSEKYIDTLDVWELNKVGSVCVTYIDGDGETDSYYEFQLEFYGLTPISTGLRPKEAKAFHDEFTKNVWPNRFNLGVLTDAV